jgi:phenylacetate-CoA ligase
MIELETRDAALFASLRAILTSSIARAPGLAEQLKGVDIAAIGSAAALARLPVLRKAELPAMQAKAPPFGGLTTSAPGDLKRLLVSPGPIFEPEGWSADWWGAAAALAAAGFRRGDIVLNCFSYHLTPGGHIMESGAHALGCAVIPGGTGNTEQQIEAIHHLKPNAYCGTPDFLKILLDKAAETGREASSIKRALVSAAALPASLRAELEGRGVKTRQAYATADLGVIAYETDRNDGALAEGMAVNDGLILEIVTPGTGDPVTPGKVGEVVVTRLNQDYPVLRLATGDLSALIAGAPSPRIRGWLGRADQTTKVKGMFVHPSQIADVGRRHPELGPLRLIVRRAGEQDEMVLRAEASAPAPGLAEAVVATLQAVTKLRGAVEFVAQGALPNDGKIIADERPVGSRAAAGAVN